MDASTTFLGLVVILLVGRTVLNLVLDGLNLGYVARHAGRLPEAYAGVMDDATYAKSVDYTKAKLLAGRWETLYDAAILALVLFSGLLPWLLLGLTQALGGSIWGQALVLVAVGFILSLPGLPWEWWNQFRLEERFGFNRSTLRLWLTDKVKGLAVGLVIGYPLICLLLWFFRRFPETWWWWAFLALAVFQLLMLVLYPRLIMPLFNKLTPLPEGELRTRLMALADRTGFQASTIQVMDGSRRSSHANAFFTGFGRFRRIVLFDTLVEQLETEELEAVLAHEIGHYRRGHVPRMLGLSLVMSLAGFALMGWLGGQEWFFAAFGFESGTALDATVILLLFSLLAGLFTFWLGPLVNLLSRKHEYEADAFAREAVGSPQPLIASLRKLYQKNLGNLTPHPLYSFFHYSHPTLLERETALKEGQPA